MHVETKLQINLRLQPRIRYIFNLIRVLWPVLTAARVGLNFINIGTIHSGISDEMKQDMTKNPDKYLNQVCEIQCMSLDKKEHTVRHGFLLRVRDDKNPEDCTVEGVFGRD